MSAPRPERSRSELVAAMPQLRDTVTRLRGTLREGLGVEDLAPEFAAVHMAGTALEWLLDAVDSTGDTRTKNFAAAAERFGQVADEIRRRLAQLHDLDQLAAAEFDDRLNRESVQPLIDAARLEVSLPNDTRAAIDIQVVDGRARWGAVGAAGLDPVDTLAQLRVTAALAALADALTPALPDFVFALDD